MSRKKLADSSLTFVAVFERDEDGWHVFLPGVQGCRTWGRSLSEARSNIREALACCLDLFDDPVAVAKAAVLVEKVRWPKAARAEFRRIQRERAKIAAAERAIGEAVSKITGEFSLRDAGELLGFSHEGVRKLLKTG